MFICRFRLCRGHLPAALTYTPRSSRFLSRHAPPTLSESHTGTVVRETPPHRETRRHLIDQTPSQSHRPPIPTRSLSPLIKLGTASSGVRSPAPAPDRTQEEEAKIPRSGLGSSALPLQKLYTELQTKHIGLASTILPEYVARIAAVASQERHAVVLDNLARNVLETFEEPERSQGAYTLLSPRNIAFFRPSIIISLLQSLPGPPHHRFIPPHFASDLTLAILDRQDTAENEALLTELVTFSSCIISTRRLNHSRPTPSQNIVVWAAFRLILRLPKCGPRMMDSALQLFQVLIDTQYIPPEAIRSVDLSSRNFDLIITLTLVRSCLHWNWHLRAIKVLQGYIAAAETLDPSIAHLSEDVLYSLVEYPTEQGLDRCVELVKDLATHPDATFVPDGHIRQIYDALMHLNRVPLAGQLYEFTRADPILLKHAYPPPRGAALPWLLRYFASYKGVHLGLARAVVGHVVQSSEPIASAHRAQFIALTAELGFARAARALWQRYSVGKYRLLVVGNAALVVRMCSLFANVIRRQSDVVEAAMQTHKDGDSEAVVSDKSQTLDKVKLAHHQDRLADYSAFAHTVLTQYRNAIEPLAKASHEALNALARANFILGNMSAGFAALQVFLNRHELPDIHDANVALSAVSVFSAREALRMIERMIARGPIPDSISFGTVIHHAAVQRDPQTVERLLYLAGQLDRQLTLKTMSSLIRASVLLSGDDKEAIRENLVRALPIIIANEDSGNLASPRLGMFCVEEAMQVEDPVLAFNFWKVMIKERTEWESLQHQTLRSTIAEGIREQCSDGRLSAEEGQALLKELEL